MVAENMALATTDRPDLDRMLDRLRKAALAFARSSLDERIALARQLLHGYLEIAEESALAGCRRKGIDPNSPLASEEWLAGPAIVIRNLRLLTETLTRLSRGDAPVDC